MKSNKTKSVMTALVVATMVCTAAMPVKAAEAQWIKENGSWSYIKEDGSKAKGWIKDNGCWYAFDDNGAMRTGWIASNEHWYFMGESGVMQSNAWVEDNGARYFIKGTGVMARDYVKDGYELTSHGKAILLAETNSVVVTDPSAVEGQVIEGNLYVDVTTSKELELKGVTVKGKLVIIGDNQTAGKVTVADSKIEAISIQTRNAEVMLSGETAVKEIVIEETSAITPDKNFKGEVGKIEVQSTTKGEIKIEVPAQEVSIRTYASIDIQAPVEHLEVKKETQVKVNADVKNVVVTESAKDTKVEISKGNTVGTIVADAPVKIEGSGTVNKIEANVNGVQASKDTIIKKVEAGKNVTEKPSVNKPSSSVTGGTTTSISAEQTKFMAIFKDNLSKLTSTIMENGAVIDINSNSITADIKDDTMSLAPLGASILMSIMQTHQEYGNLSSVIIRDNQGKTSGELNSAYFDEATVLQLIKDLFNIDQIEDLGNITLMGISENVYSFDFKLSNGELVTYKLKFSAKLLDAAKASLQKKVEDGIKTLRYEELGLGTVHLDQQTINFKFKDAETKISDMKDTKIYLMIYNLLENGVDSFTFNDSGKTVIKMPLYKEQFLALLANYLGANNTDVAVSELLNTEINVILSYADEAGTKVHVKYDVVVTADSVESVDNESNNLNKEDLTFELDKADTTIDNVKNAELVEVIDKIRE
ncbi:N-acetylmuramoyl-L-alanine amidase family protein [Dielma fastidiosa]|uniref:Cell wall binding repeat protein n=1 Tax=Dielma fastidiosa TaxID=1034346 RepID=A0AB35UHJ3_9FIRM|nr:hypothetical protein [Dielma fastidiosa]MDY5166980.1 hypothetical protein [Dielma fastidiosa]